MKWHHETHPNQYLLTIDSYQARISPSVERNSWISQVKHEGQVVHAAIFPTLLISQAWCITRIASLQAMPISQDTGIDTQNQLENIPVRVEHTLDPSESPVSAADQLKRLIIYRPMVLLFATGTGQVE